MSKGINPSVGYIKVFAESGEIRYVDIINNVVDGNTIDPYHYMYNYLGGSSVDENRFESPAEYFNYLNGLLDIDLGEEDSKSAKLTLSNFCMPQFDSEDIEKELTEVGIIIKNFSSENSNYNIYTHIYPGENYFQMFYSTGDSNDPYALLDPNLEKAINPEKIEVPKVNTLRLLTIGFNSDPDNWNPRKTFKDSTDIQVYNYVYNEDTHHNESSLVPEKYRLDKNKFSRDSFISLDNTKNKHHRRNGNLRPGIINEDISNKVRAKNYLANKVYYRNDLCIYLGELYTCVTDYTRSGDVPLISSDWEIKKDLSPELNPDVYIIKEDTPLDTGSDFTESVLFNDKDEEDESYELKVIKFTVAGGEYPVESMAYTNVGNLTISEKGRVRFYPKEDFVGEVFFTYYVIDSGGNEESQVSSIIVIPVIDPPKGNQDYFEVIEGQSIEMDVLGNDTSVEDRDLLIIKPGSLDVGYIPGEVELLANNKIIYTSKVGETGEYVIYYTPMNLENSAGERTRVTIKVLKADNPVAVQDDLSIDFNTEKELDILKNDYSPINSSISIKEITKNPSNGNIVILSGSVKYIPNEGYTGKDTFSYSLIDSDGLESLIDGVVNLTILENKPPIGKNDSFEVDYLSENNLLEVTNNDFDADGTITSIKITKYPDNGLVSVSSDGLSLIYTSSGVYQAVETVEYKVVDDKGAESELASTVTISVLQPITIKYKIREPDLRSESNNNLKVRVRSKFDTWNKQRTMKIKDSRTNTTESLESNSRDAIFLLDNNVENIEPDGLVHEINIYTSDYDQLFISGNLVEDVISYDSSISLYTFNISANYMESLSSLPPNFIQSPEKSWGVDPIIEIGPCLSLKKVECLEEFNFTSDYKSLRRLLVECPSITSLDLTSWDVSNVKDMRYTFQGDNNLKDLNISTWNLSSVENMYGAFSYVNYSPSSNAPGHLELDFLNNKGLYSVNGFSETTEFNLDFGNIISSSTLHSLWSTFSGCKLLEGKGIENINFSNIITAQHAFNDCHSLTTSFLNIEFPKLESAYSMFEGCTKINLKDFENKNLSSLKVLDRMFYLAGEFNSPVDLDLSSWSNYSENFTSIGEIFSSRTRPHSSLKSINVTGWKIPNVKSLWGLFQYQSSLESIIGIEDWDISHIEILGPVFKANKNLSIDLSSWDTSNVTTINEIFERVGSIEENNTLECLDNLMTFNTSNVTKVVHPLQVRGEFRGEYNKIDLGQYYLEPYKSWDVSNLKYIKDPFGFIDYTSSDEEVYTDFLKLFLDKPVVPTDVVLEFTFTSMRPTYTLGSKTEEYRTQLINEYNWTINDNGPK